MRVLLSTYGSRGDVQPLVALALQLKAMGAEARICAPPDAEFEQLAATFGVEFAPAFIGVRQWIAERSAQAKADLPSVAAVMMDGQYEAIGAAAEGCDVIVSTGLFPSSAAARCVAEARGLRFVFTGFCPLFLPSPHHAPCPYPGRPPPAGVTDNAALWEADADSMNFLFGGAFNALRGRLGLPPAAGFRRHMLGDHPWLAADRVLAPWLPAPLRAVQTGAWVLPDHRPLPERLDRFLAAGPPSVYVGFGSMAMNAIDQPGRVVVEAARARGRRVVLAGGWADLAPIDDAEDCFLVGEVNQQALFRRVAAVVHHGGAGTTTAAAMAGAPQVVVPQIADQPYWAARVAALGVGVAHHGPTPTVASLSDAMAAALGPDTAARAAAVAARVRADGAAVAARLLLEGAG